MKSHLRKTDVDRQARVLLTAGILVIYIITVIAVALAIDHFNPSLYNGEFYTFPNVLMLSVWFLYYVAPVILAVIFGLVFRPFWPSFRNLLLAILTVQLLVSFTFAMMHWEYLQKFQKQNRWKRNDRLRLVELAPKQYDLNEDGFLDQITVSPIFDFTKIHPGEYVLHAAIVPGGGFSPFLIDGGGTFKIVTRGPRAENKITKDFTIKPRSDRGTDVTTWEEKTFQIKFMLFRVATVDEKGKKLLRLTRWSPFLRTTDWEGGDPKITGDMILLDTLTTTEAFTLRAPEMQVPGA